MNINEYLQNHKNIVSSGRYTFRRYTSHVICADGFSMSVQVSKTRYCSPQEDDAQRYFKVEVGFPTKKEDLLMPYADNKRKPTQTHYAYVPVEVVDEVITKHGGFRP